MKAIAYWEQSRGGGIKIDRDIESDGNHQLRESAVENLVSHFSAVRTSHSIIESRLNALP